MNPEERTQRLAAFPMTNPNPVLEFSSDCTMTYCNEAGRQLAASLGAKSPTAILPDNVEAIILECLLTGESCMNLQTTTQDRTMSWSFIPVPGNRLVHCYGTDITERLNLEAQLRHSLKMEAVGQLAAGVAHDFNNILTIIQGHAAMLTQTPGLEPKCEASARQIASAAERASQLINRLLMFSRKQVMQQRHVNLNDIIENIRPMLQGLAGEHIAFEFRAAADLPALCADVGMIEQAVVNLVLNSRDAMRRGGRLVLTTSRRVLEPVATVLNPEARPGHFVCLTVADTGCGMNAATLSHMFEPFFTTKDPGQGTGLGLATVYGIIKQHQGWVMVESQPEQGSTFTIFLPSALKAAAPAPDQIPSAMSPGDETILVVEDEPALRELVVNILQLCGYRTFQAGSGPEALKVWAQRRSEIDLLLTDMVMPEGMSGGQLAEQLQAQDPGLKVIYTSGYSPGMAGKDIALLEGFNFLPKPYPPSRLAHMVRECLDAKRDAPGPKK
ncbi:MAG TPA: ATP-binding protein [Verrucomicrobiae bacterium]|jgi:two-component system cell cycle sensor histidine kinase/response regulator CckA|nr:ATP-binding protein [Verrucomicrobiae bacterium]